MNRGFLTRILVCIFVFGLCLYSYIDRQNALTRLRLEIPVVAKELKDLKEENTRLKYEIDLFESPEHLMQLASNSEFSHLKHPMSKEIVTLSEGLALQSAPQEQGEIVPVKPKITLAIGAKP